MTLRTLVLSALVGLLAAGDALSGITAEQDGKNLKVLIDGELFTEFRSDQWIPCLYPLMSPAGTHLTRRFPFEKAVPGEQADHPHHIGFWFTHGAVDGNDFWHAKKGEKIVTERVAVAPKAVDGKAASPTSLSFTADLAWLDGKGTRLLEEKRAYTISADGSTRLIDVTCTLTAASSDVTFGDTKEGSFAIRVAPTLRLKGEVAQGHITTSEGLKDDAVWGKRSRWVAYHGPDAAGTAQVIAIMDHPDNLRHPTWWHARDYGLLTANPFGPKGYKDKEWKGRGDYTLKKGDTLTQRYKLVLHQGDLASAKLGKRWEDFQN